MAEDTNIQEGAPPPTPTSPAPAPSTAGKIDAWEFAAVIIAGYLPPLLGSVHLFTADATYHDLARWAYYGCIYATVFVLSRQSMWITLAVYVALQALARFGGLGDMEKEICRDSATIFVILAFTAPAPGGWSALGLPSEPYPIEVALTDVVLAVLLFFVARIGWLLLVTAWNPGKFSFEWPMPTGDAPTGGWFIATVAYALLAIKAELLMRGYLITRLVRLLPSGKTPIDALWPTVFAVLVSAFLYGLWYRSVGDLAVIHNIVCGLLWGVVFAVTRRLTAIFLCHWMADLGPDRLLKLMMI